MQTAWDSEIAGFLADLTAVQEHTLDTLRRKRRLLVNLDTAALEAMAPEEQQLLDDLQQCLVRREQLLARAAQEGLPSSNIRTLAQALPGRESGALEGPVHQATTRMGLLQHESLAHWVLVQRTLLHLSQLLEIIATGGRLQPTYGKGEPAPASGAFVDHAA
jgi:hypothetical protein